VRGWRQLIDLTSIDDPELAPGALASVIGLAPCSENQLPYLAPALRGKRALLVVDNCEHLSGAAVALAKDVSRGALGVQILSISREPTQVEGEHIHRPASLASPPRVEQTYRRRSAHLPCCSAVH
jgi:predicted ATPase